jgi:hypothetical protein
MKTFNALLSIVLLAVSAPVLSACIKGGKPTTPSSLFVVTGNEVLDTRTKLTWSRCPLGMNLMGNQCSGSAKLMTLQEAKRHSKQLGSGWRLPSISELLGIVEQRCSNPAINAEIFPGVVELYEGQAKYWSRTPFQEIPSLFHNVDFMDGSVDANSPGIVMAVRLVRNKTK